jgi:hypothetical protein
LGSQRGPNCAFIMFATFKINQELGNNLGCSESQNEFELNLTQMEFVAF